ncbi:hypothetical protein [Gynuella sunshinyii]|uniref:N-acetyltransferase domain-containing protein n=1 Tax=Gynuella sunshinyii YC6258 TaxID=1445510 RepID=A0A0C5V2E6_9GAMM|nr:hypothetical protein [Gynuella sunshinyii]AJQ93670.1 hypothetical Protein YC6258_01622 [Gynuella sunshinyii YC6258]
MNGLELFGYFGSMLVAISLMMSNLKKLRWINLFGSSTFATYGLLIKAWPVFFLNGWIAAVDIFYLWLLYRQRDQFSLIELDLNYDKSKLAQLFVGQYQNDIKRFFSRFSIHKLKECQLIITFRNLKPCGLLAYQLLDKNGETKAWIELDYVSPEFRDYKNAEVVFLTLKERLKQAGVNSIETLGGHQAHEQYLQRIGFTQSGDPSIFEMKNI